MKSKWHGPQTKECRLMSGSARVGEFSALFLSIHYGFSVLVRIRLVSYTVFYLRQDEELEGRLNANTGINMTSR